jgi:type I site-specific restriction-modification system R (restriction) subunit
VENFLLFDASKPGGTRKVVARNQQILGVNNAVASVIRQEQLKKAFPPNERLRYDMLPRGDDPLAAEDENAYRRSHESLVEQQPADTLPLVKRAHPDLGRLGVFWHTQGSGKSYSMIFFTEKVRRLVPGNFTFVIMTDREDLDEQIYKTFVGCDAADEHTPRAASGKQLQTLLTENHRYVFSLIHKFNQDVHPNEPYSRRDDIIVISDEAHRTQAAKLARNMRLALPNASFIGFTGTPLFTYDHLTRRIFGTYISRYDFKRSEEDGATVKLVYENRGEKLGLTRLDLNDRIAEKIEEADLIRPHRELMKRGFDMPDGRRIDVEDAFKDPAHPFRVAIVCAMWLTGFDVECLSTLYIDKPMKAHTLMQAIARANRRYADKTCGVIVDYNGMLRGLREALAQYALGDEPDDGGDGEEIVAPIEELVKALVEAIEAAEQHVNSLGFDISQLQGATGFERIEALRDATNAVYTSDEAKRRFEILARLVFARFKALLMEPAAFVYAERHDNIEAIYKKLQERRDTSDVTELLKELHKIVNEAIRTQGTGEDHAEGLTVDLSQLDFQKLRDEFAKVRRKQALLQDIREMVEQKLQQMLRYNPLGMDYYKKYQEIIADYNREKDRTTVEEAFARLFDLANILDAEQQRAAQEGLSRDELALFDLLSQTQISKADRERLKQASKRLLASLQELLKPMENWTQKEQTQAEVKVFILDRLFETLPNPSYSTDETQAAADRIYEYIWQHSANGSLFPPDMAA